MVIKTKRISLVGEINNYQRQILITVIEISQWYNVHRWPDKEVKGKLQANNDIPYRYLLSVLNRYVSLSAVVMYPNGKQ